MVESQRESQNADSARLGVAGSLALATRWSGAVISVGLVLAIVYWAFTLGQRDASEVPVIRAMAGEARITPDDPGGAEAANQGLEVNEVLASDTPTDVNTETALAPEPQNVTDEDEPMADLAEAATPEVEAADASSAEAVDAGPMRVDASDLLVDIVPDDGGADADEDTTPSVAADGMTTPIRRPDTMVPRPEEADPELENIIDSLIDQALPEEGSTSLETVDPVLPPPPFGNPVLDPGAALIQLGAFDTVERADLAWTQYQAAHGDLIGGLDRYIERIEAGGRLLFLLRAAGFADLNETQAMCAALNARDVECISATLQ